MVKAITARVNVIEDAIMLFFFMNSLYDKPGKVHVQN
jgi:hypothetical protein